VLVQQFRCRARVAAGDIFCGELQENLKERASWGVRRDEPRVMALLATAYGRPVEACVVAKLRRACERWTEGEKALAHIHLAHAGLPHCDEQQALRLFVADELVEAGATPKTLMPAQGFDPALLALLKFNPNHPRVGLAFNPVP
jgi:hypothetical protein